MRPIVLFLISMLHFQSAMAVEFSIIVNKKNTFVGEIKGYYTLKDQRWPNNNPVEPFDILVTDNLDVAIARNIFIRKQLGFSSVGAYLEYWIRQKSKGLTKKPLELSTFGDVLRFVQKEEGGIGYVPSDIVKDVRVLKVFEL